MAADERSIDPHEVLMHAASLADGPAKVAMLEEAIALADNSNNVETAYLARTELLGAALQQGMGERLVVAFSWCLAQSDRDPQTFPETELLWQYRWVMFAMPSFPNVSKAQIDSMLADMEMRYRRAGSSMRGYYLLRKAVRRMMGDRFECQEAFAAFKAARRDSLSDDAVTERTFSLDYHVFMQEYRLAYTTMQPFLTGEIRDKHFLAATFSTMLVPMLRLGHVEAAMNNHKKCYPLISENPRYIGDIGDHMKFLTLTNNLTRATRIYEKHLTTALSVKDRLKQFTFHLGATLTLSQLAKERETVRLRLPKTFDGYRSEGTYVVAALRDYSLEHVRGEAAAYDARNGNDFYTKQVAELDELLNLRRDFPAAGVP